MKFTYQISFKAEWYGCDRQGSYDSIINPTRSARVTTVNSFAFKFGTIEIRAKNPAGKLATPFIRKNLILMNY